MQRAAVSEFFLAEIEITTSLLHGVRETLWEVGGFTTPSHDTTSPD